MKSNAAKSVNTGFSLVELLVVVGLLGILAAAFVSMGDLVREYRVGYASQRLYNALTLAKSEAIKRNDEVTICRSTSGTACNNGTSWHEGWIIFADANDNRTVNTGEAIIKIYKDMGSYQITYDGNSDAVTFDAKGRAHFNSDQQFAICVQGISNGPRRHIIVHGLGGRLEQAADTGNC